jgi:hypothetical protein
MSHLHPFQVGDRVVCINDYAPRTSNDAPRLELGEIYTVTRVSFGFSGSTDQAIPGVHLAEAPFRDDRRHGFIAARFELHERATRA